jgi:hypothetical protein
MGLEVGGYTDVPDWPKLGPSLLIATCLILSIRTAKWPAHTKRMLGDSELDQEVDFAEYLATKVLSHLMARNEAMFPKRKQPWYQARIARSNVKARESMCGRYYRRSDKQRIAEAFRVGGRFDQAFERQVAVFALNGNGSHVRFSFSG